MKSTSCGKWKLARAVIPSAAEKTDFFGRCSWLWSSGRFGRLWLSEIYPISGDAQGPNVVWKWYGSSVTHVRYMFGWCISLNPTITYTISDHTVTAICDGNWGVQLKWKQQDHHCSSKLCLALKIWNEASKRIKTNMQHQTGHLRQPENGWDVLGSKTSYQKSSLMICNCEFYWWVHMCEIHNNQPR